MIQDTAIVVTATLSGQTSPIYKIALRSEKLIKDALICFHTSYIALLSVALWGRIMAGLTQRTASLGDLKEIWSLLGRVATDVPFDFESEAEQESILSELMACCTSGLSPIAVAEDKAIIGALLVRRDDFDWGFRNGDAVHMSYAAVASGHRDRGVLQALVAEIQQRKVPVYASVKTGNQFGLADALEKLGFAHECTAASGWGDLYKWSPSRSR